MDIATLGISVDSSGVKSASGDLRVFVEVAGKVEVSVEQLGKEMGRTNRAVDQGAALWNRLKTAMGFLSTFVGVRALQQMADTWSDINARVGLAIGNMNASSAVLDRLSIVARRTYSDLNLTAESFIRNSTTLRELGKNTAQQLDYTEALNLALVVSGARAERAAQLQEALSKAMALGALRGDELNTVIMNGGRVAEVIAEQLGVGVNQLRSLGEQGKITGDVVYQALTSRLTQLRAEAEKMPATIGDAFTLMRNSLLQYIGAVDQSNKLSETLAQTLILIGDNMNIVAGIAAGAATAGFFAMAGAIRSAITATIAFTVALATNPLGLLAVAISAVVGLLVAYKDQFVSIGTVTTSGGKIMGAAWATLTGVVRAYLTYLSMVYDVAKKLFTLDWSGITKTISDGADEIKKIALETAAAWRSATTLTFEDRWSGVPTEPPAGGGGGGGGGGGSQDTQRAQKRLEQLRASLAGEDAELRLGLQRQLESIKEFEQLRLINRQEADQLRLQAANAHQDQVQELLFNQFAESWATEQELLLRKHEQQLELLQQFEDNKTITIEKAEHYRTKLMEQHAQARMLLQARSWSALAGTVDTAMGHITTALGQEGGKQFGIMKMIASATALVKGYEAVVSAWASGNATGIPGMGAVMASITAAGVAAQIVALNSTNVGGSKQMTTGAGGGGAVSAPPPPPVAQQQEGRSVNITLSGRSFELRSDSRAYRPDQR